MKLWYCTAAAFIAYQTYAYLRNDTRITELSRTSMAPLVWGWVCALGLHLISDEV